ncbi:PaaI family thioesterase [Actinokineospora sp. NBRC 105648]|uniref:PaaI family thioesterase n=1 Tax=Actinokineospora sp. NBRC 105648 TaxID=3032206 RepID=UPI0024A4E2EF|nr:PaaI family thioesterase [Actinokineospora sp. NBRC 105648]GLZ42506.1 aromatic compound degradation protein PaaI [Actinokineospora sp. NBRC 105648]
MTAPAEELLLAQLPFARLLGVRLVTATREEVRAELDWSPERCTVFSVMHGGALMGIADTVGGVLAYLNLPAGAQTSTVESKTNFLRAVRAGVVTAVATPMHVGAQFIVAQTNLLDDTGALVAQTTQTQAVLHPRR